MQNRQARRLKWPAQHQTLRHLAGGTGERRPQTPDTLPHPGIRGGQADADQLERENPQGLQSPVRHQDQNQNACHNHRHDQEERKIARVPEPEIAPAFDKDWSSRMTGCGRSDGRPRNRLHLCLEDAGLLVTAFRLPLQCAQDHFIQAHVNHDLVRRRLERFAGQFAGEHLVKHHAQRVDIGAVVHLGRALGLLGRHVAWRAHDLAGVRQGL